MQVCVSQQTWLSFLLSGAGAALPREQQAQPSGNRMFGLGTGTALRSFSSSFSLSADFHVIQIFAYFSENLSLLPESFK